MQVTKVRQLRNVLLPILLLLVALVVAGCGGGTPSGPSTYTVSGRITNPATEQGIPGVTLSFGSSGTATTNDDGTWSKSGLTGSVTVTPAKTGWTFSPASSSVTQAASNVNFSGTAPDVTVSGKVVDSSGNPLNGAAVNLGSKSALSGLAGSGPLISPSSPGDGSFSFTIQPGSYDLKISKSGFANRTEPVVLEPSSTPIPLGNYTLTLTVPSYGGAYTDPNVVVPAFQNGVSVFDVPTPSSDNVAWLMIFPQTDTAGDYSWDFENSPSARASKGATSRAAKRTSRPVRQMSEAAQFQYDLRLSEKDAWKYRSTLLHPRSKELMRDSLGDTRTFKKKNKVTGLYETVSATVKAVGTYCVVYVDDSNPVLQSTVDEVRNFFDSNRPSEVATFGTELDEDGNGKIIILLTPLPTSSGTLFGYFSWINELPTSINADSNAADMIFVNPDVNVLDLKATLAHEYQHLIFFSERLRNSESPLSDTWINEAFAVLAEDLANVGYQAGAPCSVDYVKDWLSGFDTWSLTDFDGSNESYGGGYVFARYLYDHYGASAVLKINRSAYGGTQAVTNAIGGTFADVFRSFVGSIPFGFHRVSSPDSRLGFPSGIDLTVGGGPIAYLFDASNGYTAGGTLRPWSFEIFLIAGGAPNTRMNISLSTATAGNYGAIAVTGF